MDTEPTANPRQFGLIDIFAAMTLVALLVAMLSPFVRHMKTEYRSNLLLVAALQMALAGGAIIHATHRRQRLLSQAGRRLGSAFYGTMNWPAWPLVKSIINMLFLSTVQLGFAAAIAFAPSRIMIVPMFLMYHVQLAILFGYMVCRYMWRVYPNSLEFFEHGVARSGVEFRPWSQIELRPSQFFPDRIAVVFRPGGTQGFDTKMCRVTPELRTRAFDAASLELEK